MKKTIKVECIMALARQEVEFYKKYVDEGKYEFARAERQRIDAFQSVIMVLAVGACKNFDDKWMEIHKEIWGV